MAEGGIDAQDCQRIELTRKEFLMLKVYLGRLRQLQLPAEEPLDFKGSGLVLPSIWRELEPEEIAAVPEAAHAN